MKKLLLLSLLAAPELVLAHPGHGSSDGISLWHYLSSYEHSIALAGLILLTVLIVRYRHILKKTA